MLETPIMAAYTTYLLIDSLKVSSEDTGSGQTVSAHVVQRLCSAGKACKEMIYNNQDSFLLGVISIIVFYKLR